MGRSVPARTDVFAIPGYLKFWAAETVSGFGGYITTIALQVLVVLTLHGTAIDVGLLNSARWVPYLILGLVAGALVDRRRRKPILVGTDLGRGLLLCVIPLLWVFGWLNLPGLLAIMVLFGLLSLFNDAATMSFLPRLVPSSSLLGANARLDQSAAVAQTSGPLVGGALVSALGAPLAVLVDAATYLFSAVVTARIRISEPTASRGPGSTRLRREIGEGLRFVYRHRVLGPLAVTTHGWFLFNSILNTVFVPFVLLGLHFSAFQFGVALAFAGAGGLLGSVYSTRIGLRWGAGRTVIACNALEVVAWVVIVLAPGGAGDTGPWFVVAVVAAGQALYGVGLGASNANEMGYRQSVTPDALQARVNTTMRAGNRAAIVVGAPLGGVLAEVLGYRETLWIGAAGFVLVTIALAASPFRTARHGDGRPSSDRA